MKKANKRPTRAQRDSRGEVPQQHKCNGCGYKFPSKFALKEHKLERGCA